MTHYDVLEVSPKASAEVIRAAYKSLMQRYHPDKNAGLADKAKDAARITQAYEVLADAGKRAAYDLELAGAGAAVSAATYTGRTRPARTASSVASAAYGRPGPAPERRSWLAWVVIVCILVAGSIFLLQWKKPAKPVATPGELQGATAAPASGADRAPAAASARPVISAPAQESAADLQARIVPSFATSLRIELGPIDRPPGAALRVLHIPELGFRMDGPEAARWAREIEALRAPLLQRLLAQLPNAEYDELMGKDGDIYLKRMIGNAVLDGIRYKDTSPPPVPPPPPPPGAVPQPPPLPVLPVVVLLPQSFSVR